MIRLLLLLLLLLLQLLLLLLLLLLYCRFQLSCHQYNEASPRSITLTESIIKSSCHITYLVSDQTGDQQTTKKRSLGESNQHCATLSVHFQCWSRTENISMT